MNKRFFSAVLLGGVGACLFLSSCLSRNFSSQTRSVADPNLLAPLIINGKVVEATNPYLTENFIFRNNLGLLNLGQSPEYWAQRKSEFTEDLFLKGMDFIKKGPSGAYDTPFAVPVEPMVVLMERPWLDAYAQSAGRWIEICRAFLAEVFSTQQPSKEGIKKRLGISSDAHDSDIDIALARMTSSMYFIEGFVHPNMQNYPFLPITGWDAIISNYEKAEGFNFEVNAGTPSGISNLSAMLDNFATRDPDQANILGSALQADDTFDQMQSVLKQSAKKWTGVDGIAVVVSPGEFNGAHPDVASISLLSGMPLVKPGDLFLASEGYLHLRLANGQSQRVTAIYSRMEESFIFQEGDRLSQSAIPMIQTWFDNDLLAKKTGLKLNEGVWYDYLIDGATSEITGVNKSQTGEPLIARSYSPIYQHATNQKTLRQLVIDRKVFVNLIGGRIIDDKKIFKIFSSIGKDLFKPDLVGGPPETLSDNAYEALIAEPENFVIKRTDRSGGDGVYVLRNLTKAEQQKRVQELLQSEGQGYTVQRFTPSIAQPTIYQRAGTWAYTQLLGDFRVFVFVDPNGKPYVGDRGFLYRVAPFDPNGDNQQTPWSKPVANTSQGGGYGIIAVNGPKTSPKQSNPPRWVSKASGERLVEFLQHAGQVTKKLEIAQTPTDDELRQLEFLQKAAMHILGWPSGAVRAWASRARENPNKENLVALLKSLKDLRTVFDQANEQLANVVIVPQGGCSDILKAPPLAYQSQIRSPRSCLTFAF